MFDEEPQSIPIWVKDELVISRLLNTFIDKIDAQQKRLAIKITEKTLPELFDYNQFEAALYLWSLIDDELHKKHAVLTLKMPPKKSRAEDYADVILYFNLEQESLVRYWLGRVISESYTKQWRQALTTMSTCFESDQNLLSLKPIRQKNKSADQVVQGFVSIGEALRSSTTPLTLRCLSSRYFGGDSKFLERKEDTIGVLYPSLIDNIKPRPVLTTVYIPEVFTAILFIENEDSFLSIVDNIQQYRQPAKTAIVYSVGFRSAAARIRTMDHVMFATVNPVSNATLQRFTQWWFAENDQPAVACFFWGDLDFSAMTILLALRKLFPNMTAWQIGYEPMLEYQQQEVGHSLDEAGKEKQKDPLSTGCNYADQVLLPSMRKRHIFLDQEIIDVSQLQFLPNQFNG